jgi:AraC-like DNA-binding protein
VERAVWTRVGPVAGQVLDLLHARVTEPYAPHLHEEFALGACTDGLEVIRYRGTLHYAGPGSVVILEPGEPHTGGPADLPSFVYRVMYPAADLLYERPVRAPRFREPVVIDPGLARELRQVHTLLSRAAGPLQAGPLQAGPLQAGSLEPGPPQAGSLEPGPPQAGSLEPGPLGVEPLEAESRLSWLLGELVRRHASRPPDGEVRGAGRVARLVMAQLADRLSCPPALTEIAAEAGLSRYQLVRSFRAEVGLPPYAWLAQHRVARARVLLERGYRPAEAAALTGFADQAHLTRWFRRVVGVTPGAYRNSVQDNLPRYR